VHEVEVTISTLKQDFLNKAFDAFVAIKNNEVVGMALYYPVYSTWKGKSIHLEDLVVKQSERRKGIGKMLFDVLVNEAKKLKAGRLQWQVLDWNKSAIAFYKNYPAQFDGEWINVKITNQELQNI
ncbi:MAG: GNAT family N-acetyltransferase, partial [Bacteroidia bacterium]